MKQILLFILVAISFCLQSAELTYYPTNFLQQNLHDAALKQALSNIVGQCHQMNEGGNDTIIPQCKGGKGQYSHSAVSYKSARRIIMGDLYLNQTANGQYFIHDVYCNKDITKGVGPNKIPDNDVVNIEHSWPQSQFGGSLQSMQKADLHHLFPTESKANGMRGNMIFAEVTGTGIYAECMSSIIGIPEQTSGRYKEKAFEPPDQNKGDIARALFYFSIRYHMAIPPTEEFYLKKWHHDDPVDENEIARNNKIFEYQKNRNPFIDYPELVDNISDF